jgi:hypothetical protein
VLEVWQPVRGSMPFSEDVTTTWMHWEVTSPCDTVHSPWLYAPTASLSVLMLPTHTVTTDSVWMLQRAGRPLRRLEVPHWQGIAL